jgi:hypothetical protein
MVTGVATPAAADPVGDCSTTTGVIVAVDFATWGGNIERGCDAALTTGYDALHVAGFTTAADAQDGPAFICRIDNQPSPAEQACLATPPADAYWSFWYADAGQDTWTYSQVGAASYHPPGGSVDAWTFGATDIDGTDGQPSFPPSAVRATDTSGSSGSTTTTSVTTTTGTAPTPVPVPSVSGAGGGPPVAVRPSSPSTIGADGAGAGRGTASSTTEPAPTSSTTWGSSASAPGPGKGTVPRIVDAAPAAIHRPSPGSPAPALVGAGVIAVLTAAAGLVAWRRRRVT